MTTVLSLRFFHAVHPAVALIAVRGDKPVQRARDPFIIFAEGRHLLALDPLVFDEILVELRPFGGEIVPRDTLPPFSVRNEVEKLLRPIEDNCLLPPILKGGLCRRPRPSEGRGVNVVHLPLLGAFGKERGFPPPLLCERVVFVIGISVANEYEPHIFLFTVTAMFRARSPQARFRCRARERRRPREAASPRRAVRLRLRRRPPHSQYPFFCPPLNL